MQVRDLEVLEDLKGMHGTWDQSSNPPLRRKRCNESDQSSGHLLSRITIEVNVSMTTDYLGWALCQTSEWVYRISLLGLEGGKNSIYAHRAIALSSVHSIPPGRTSHKGTAYHGKNFSFLSRGEMRICSINPPLPLFKSQLWLSGSLFAAEEHLVFQLTVYKNVGATRPW